MGRIRKFAVEMTRRVNRGESQTGPSPALGNPHQTPVPTFPQRWRRRAAWQRQSPTPLKSGPLTDSCTEPYNYCHKAECPTDSLCQSSSKRSDRTEHLYRSDSQCPTCDGSRPASGPWSSTKACRKSPAWSVEFDSVALADFRWCEALLDLCFHRNLPNTLLARAQQRASFRPQ